MKGSIKLSLPPLRVCKVCGLQATTTEDLDLFKYNKSCLFKREPMCKKCSRKRAISSPRYYEYQKEYKKKVSLSNKLKATGMLGGCCNHCKLLVTESNYVVFDFHHLDPTQKEKQLAQLLNDRKIGEKAVKELKKCILLCSNCHKLEHKRIRDGG